MGQTGRDESRDLTSESSTYNKLERRRNDPCTPASDETSSTSNYILHVAAASRSSLCPVLDNPWMPEDLTQRKSLFRIVFQKLQKMTNHPAYSERRLTFDMRSLASGETSGGILRSTLAMRR